ncbi:MAG: hypothetical protein EOP85_00160 [Verrucomicrobiaceae bacterium]|nr:MAG: hypothetical protein EOP85_00160 [Verrucomicrobiaceae bacterium]
MNTRNIGRRFARKFNRLLMGGGLNSCEILLRWRVMTGLPVDHDPHLAVSVEGAVHEDKSEIARCFVHYVNIHTTGYTRHTEIQSGDVILDFPGDVSIDGREGLEFVIGGKIYVQKNGGKELAESWDVRCNGVPVTRTVLATLKT